MKKRYRSLKNKKVTIGFEDVAAAVGGGIASLVLNGLIDKVADRIAPDNKDMVKKAVPLAKAAVGAYLAVNGEGRLMKFGGLGFAGVASVEAAHQFAPEWVSIDGVGVDLFSSLGTSDSTMLLEIDPQMLSGSDYDDKADFETDTILGTEDLYEDMGIL